MGREGRQGGEERMTRKQETIHKISKYITEKRMQEEKSPENTHIQPLPPPLTTVRSLNFDLSQPALQEPVVILTLSIRKPRLKHNGPRPRTQARLSKTPTVSTALGKPDSVTQAGGAEVPRERSVPLLQGIV